MKSLNAFFRNNIFNAHIALSAVMVNKLRSFLTALGIIFGVAAVIAMLAVGNGARQEVLQQIKMVGVNNILIQPLQQKSSEAGEKTKQEKKKYTPGLTIGDMEAIKAELACIQRVSPEIVINTSAIREGLSQDVQLVGIMPEFFSVYNLTVQQGRAFNNVQLRGAPVCIIGKNIETRFFNTESAIGKKIKVGNNWLEVIGVLDNKLREGVQAAKLGVHDYANSIFTPIKCVLLRYQNRIYVNTPRFGNNNQGSNDDSNDNTKAAPDVNYNQLDKLVVQVSETELLNAATDVISRLLRRRHNNIIDYEITIPELLLKQQQRTKDIFNLVLASIAGISLVVGGIGIMNIMLASVLERIREIGIRLAIGATKRDIIVQFLCEAVFISLFGGIAGIALGIVLSEIIAKATHITVIISAASILTSFGVSVAVGLAFGIMPARKAAMEDPVNSLRYE